MAMRLKIKRLHEKAVIPTYAHDGDVGLDLYAIEDVMVYQGQVAKIPIGIAIELPPGYGGFVHSRSGLAAKAGVFIPNGPGVIDPNYRGEIQVLLAYNGQAHTETGKIMYAEEQRSRPKSMIKEMIPYYFIRQGERIGQLVVSRCETPEIEEVTELGSTERGEGALGSSGL